MTETVSILQCDACQRQHDGAGGLTALRFGVPVLVACGRPDCATVAAALALEERERVEAQKSKIWKPIFDRRQRVVASNREKKQGKHRAAPVARATFRSSCAASEARNVLAGSEDEFNGADKEALNAERGVRSAELPHAERQRAFVAEGKGANDNERMLELLFGCAEAGTGHYFNPQDPARRSRGPWISKADLIHKFFIDTPNSRASELRGSETHPGHPLVNQWRLDVDNSSDGMVTGHAGGVSCYSVCFVEVSCRLARERELTK